MCETPDCDRPVVIQKSQLCLTCYGKQWRATNPERMAIYAARHSTATGIAHCHRCDAEVPHPLRLCEDCRPLVKEERNLRQRLRNYSLTPVEFDALTQAQGGECTICAQSKPLVIDYDHETNAVRGLLCDQCNRGLGMFMDSTANLSAAMAYLERAQRVSPERA